MRNDQPRTASVIGFCMVVATTLVPAFAQYESVVLSDNPLVYYRLGGSARPTAINDGRLGDGTYHGEITFEEPGLILHGDTSIFSNGGAINSNLLPVAGLSTATFEFWATPDVDTQRDSASCIICNDGGPRIYKFGVNKTTGNYYSEFFGSGNQGFIEHVPPTGGVDHVVVVYDAPHSERQFWLNGELQLSTVITGSAINSGGNSLVVGRRFPAPDNREPYVGMLDEIAIYDTPFSAESIAAHYAAGSGGTGLSP